MTILNKLSPICVTLLAVITYACRFAPASEISIYNYFGIIFSILLGALILREPIKLTSVIGGVLVAAASVMLYLYNRRKDSKIIIE